MKFHIVRFGENLKQITKIYSLTNDEVKECNRHVRDWNRLVPGTKLKIPIITEVIDQDILDMEPFIEDYYPKTVNSSERVKIDEDEKNNTNDKVENGEKVGNTEEINDLNNNEIRKVDNESNPNEKEESNYDSKRIEETPDEKDIIEKDGKKEESPCYKKLLTNPNSCLNNYNNLNNTNCCNYPYLNNFNYYNPYQQIYPYYNYYPYNQNYPIYYPVYYPVYIVPEKNNKSK